MNQETLSRDSNPKNTLIEQIDSEEEDSNED